MTSTQVSKHTASFICPHKRRLLLLQLYIYWLAYVSIAGDPKADLAYERQYEQQTYHVIPEVIKNFLQYFHKTTTDLIDQKVYELQANRVSSESIRAEDL